MTHSSIVKDRQICVLGGEGEFRSENSLALVSIFKHINFLNSFYSPNLNTLTWLQKPAPLSLARSLLQILFGAELVLARIFWQKDPLSSPIDAFISENRWQINSNIIEALPVQYLLLSFMMEIFCSSQHFFSKLAWYLVSFTSFIKKESHGNTQHKWETNQVVFLVYSNFWTNKYLFPLQRFDFICLMRLFFTRSKVLKNLTEMNKYC